MKTLTSRYQTGKKPWDEVMFQALLGEKICPLTLKNNISFKKQFFGRGIKSKDSRGSCVDCFETLQYLFVGNSK